MYTCSYIYRPPWIPLKISLITACMTCSITCNNLFHPALPMHNPWSLESCWLISLWPCPHHSGLGPTWQWTSSRFFQGHKIILVIVDRFSKSALLQQNCYSNMFSIIFGSLRTSSVTEALSHVMRMVQVNGLEDDCEHNLRLPPTDQHVLDPSLHPGPQLMPRISLQIHNTPEVSS